MPKGLRVARWLKIAVGASLLGLTVASFSAVGVTVVRVGPNVHIGCLLGCHVTEATQPATPLIRWPAPVLTVPAAKTSSSKHETKTPRVARSRPTSRTHALPQTNPSSLVVYRPARSTIRTSESSKVSVKTSSTSQTSSTTSGSTSGSSSATATGSASGSASSCTVMTVNGVTTRSSGCGP